MIRAKTHNTDAGAKRLAAYFGLSFSWAIIILAGLDLAYEAKALASIFAFFASLELIFNFCVGCKIYFIYKRITA